MSESNGPARRSATLAPTALEAAQRRRRGVHAALEALERSVAAPSAGRERVWSTGLADHLGALQRAFLHHVEATEGQGGLFEEVIDQAPRLVHEVAKLTMEHRRITHAIDAAFVLAARPDAAGRVAEISEDVLDVLTQVTRHRHLGASLVYEAYSVDIDAAD